MDQVIINKLYQNDIYLNYLRYHPKWYIFLEKNPNAYMEFEKQVKKELKLTLSDQIEKFKKQVDFINGIIKYLNN